jgi:hypothetical protein
MSFILKSNFTTGDGTRFRSRAAFTIVELMVAAAVTLILLGLMVQITLSVLKTFDKVTGSLTTKTQATTALEYIRKDFQSIVWRRDENAWLIATIQGDQNLKFGGSGDTNISTAQWNPTGNPKPGNADSGMDYSSLRLENPDTTSANRVIALDEYRFGQAGVWLRFFTKQVTASTTTSAPIAVAYQIVRIKPRANSTEYRYQLFRSTVRPGPNTTNLSVLFAGYDLLVPAATIDNYNSTPTAATNDAIGDPGSVRKPDREVLLANNVIDFGVRFWTKSAGGALALQFPATGGVPDNKNLAFVASVKTPASIVVAGIPYHVAAASDTLTEGYPDFVDVVIRVLTDEGARVIEAYENGNSVAPPKPSSSTLTLAQWQQAYWWTLALEHSVVYVERIPITARPL